jgi:polyhydroxybutyrate depolymerase
MRFGHIVLLLAVAGSAWACSGESDSGGDSGPSDDGGPDAGDYTPPTCAPGTKDGEPGSTDGLMSAAGVPYNVRVPEDYDPTVGHPLLMVCSPAGATEFDTEWFTGLTPPALEAGYIVAYADWRSPQYSAYVADLGSIPAKIAERWCVDENRVYLTGYSDGATMTSLMVIWEQVEPRPAAIAPSAAGVSAAYLAGQTCPPPVPVMVLHSSGDTLFPGYGAQAATWWAECNGCDPEPGDPAADGCVAYTGCVEDVEVRYCEGTGAHGYWQDLNESMLQFFERFHN